MRKPFDNKSHYDPGRFKYKLQIINVTGQPNPYGNSEVSGEILTTVKAIKLQIGSYDQYAIQAGASVLNNDVYFIIRPPKEINILKTTSVNCEGKQYKVHSIIELDQPKHYLKLLCIWEG